MTTCFLKENKPRNQKRSKRVLAREEVWQDRHHSCTIWSWTWLPITFAIFMFIWSKLKVQLTSRGGNKPRAWIPGGMDSWQPFKKPVYLNIQHNFHKKSRTIGKATLWLWCIKTKAKLLSNHVWRQSEGYNKIRKFMPLSWLTCIMLLLELCFTYA